MENITIKQSYQITEYHYIVAIGHLMVCNQKITKKNIKEVMIDGLQRYGQDCYLSNDGFDWQSAEELYNKMYR